MASLPFRPLGSSGIPVSVMSLGSWRTFERISSAGEAVMRAAARRASTSSTTLATTTRPARRRIPTATRRWCSASCSGPQGWQRDEIVVANKLWWEFWPEQSAADELDGVARADGTRPHRSDLRQPAARHDHTKSHGGRGRRVGMPGSSLRAWPASGRWRCGRRRSSPRHSTSPPSSAPHHRSRTSWPESRAAHEPRRSGDDRRDDEPRRAASSRRTCSPAAR